MYKIIPMCIIKAKYFNYEKQMGANQNTFKHKRLTIPKRTTKLHTHKSYDDAKTSRNTHKRTLKVLRGGTVDQ